MGGNPKVLSPVMTLWENRTGTKPKYVRKEDERGKKERKKERKVEKERKEEKKGKG